MATFSIVTPSFNQGAYLDETMRSVLDQEGVGPVEYLVADGGSTDGSADIIRRYADRLAWWVSEPDGGQSDAINKGWQRVTGDYVAFLNSDDTYFPGALARVAAAFEANPDAGVVYGQAQWVTEDGVPTSQTGLFVDGQVVLDRLIGLPQPAAFVRREVLERVGLLDPSFHFALDGEFYIRAVGSFRAVALPDVLASMRLHADAKSVATSTGFAPEVSRLVEKVIASPQNYPRYTVDPGKLRAMAHVVASRYYFINGEYRTSLSNLRQALAADRAVWRRIAKEEAPRFVARMVLGRRLYGRLSGLSMTQTRRSFTRQGSTLEGVKGSRNA
ncbi:MAG TPA: glycosyltransferase family 2 protein [Rubricoccaceae bacterium]|jgi:glycosyltransferase involved in cell wall biosynthesis